MNKLKQIWSNLRSSFWFARSLIVAVSIAIAVALIEAGSIGSDQWLARWPRLFGVVLGIFTGIFTYCPIVLRTIRGGEESGFIPNIAVYFGVVLAIGGISVLIFFIHHIASSIQASTIIASVASETMVAVDRHFPDKLGNGQVDGEEDQSPLPLSACRWQAVATRENGYIQNVDIALRSLSPSINDTTTAVMYVDYLAAILARLAPRKIPPSYRTRKGN